MPRRRRCALVGGLCVALLLPACVRAQGLLAATVAPGRVAFPDPGVREFDGGSVRLEGVEVDVRVSGSRPWVLTVRSENPDLGGYGKPLSDLQWRLPGGDWRPVSTGREVVEVGAGSRRVRLDLRALLSWDRDRPGSYDAGLTFEVRPGRGGGAAGAGPGAGPGGRVSPPGGDASAICARVAVALGGPAPARRRTGHTGPAGSAGTHCPAGPRDALPTWGSPASGGDPAGTG